MASETRLIAKLLRPKRKPRGKPFPKGNPGRPKGAKRHATVEIRDASRALVEDPEYRVQLRVRLCEGRAPHMETLLFQYAYGKPRDYGETVQLTPELLDRMSPEQLERVAAGEPLILVLTDVK